MPQLALALGLIQVLNPIICEDLLRNQEVMIDRSPVLDRHDEGVGVYALVPPNSVSPEGAGPVKIESLTWSFTADSDPRTCISAAPMLHSANGWGNMAETAQKRDCIETRDGRHLGRNGDSIVWQGLRRITEVRSICRPVQ